jgi:hypothetical protein
MTPSVCREVDNRHKDGKFVNALQDEITALRNEVKRLREIIRAEEMDQLLVELAR